jgi:hypothetical protein
MNMNPHFKAHKPGKLFHLKREFYNTKDRDELVIPFRW